jgi:hypothetical protein
MIHFETSADTSLDPVIFYLSNRALLYFRFLTPLDATKFHDTPVVMYKGRQTRDITKIFKGFVAVSTLFILYFSIPGTFTITLQHILSISLLLLVCSLGKTPLGAEPRNIHGPALQQASALPTYEYGTL